MLSLIVSAGCFCRQKPIETIVTGCLSAPPPAPKAVKVLAPPPEGQSCLEGDTACLAACPEGHICVPVDPDAINLAENYETTRSYAETAWDKCKAEN